MGKLLANKNGFSLIEMMVVVTIGGIMTLSMMTMFQNQFNAMKKLNAKQEAMDMAKQVEMLLMNVNACEETFVGLSFKKNGNAKKGIDSRVTDEIKLGTGKLVYSKDQVINSTLTIERMYLDIAVRAEATLLVDVPVTTNLIIQFKSGGVVGTIRPAIIPLYMIVDEFKNIRNIITCSSDPNQIMAPPPTPGGPGTPLPGDDNKSPQEFQDFLASDGLPAYPKEIGCRGGGTGKRLSYGGYRADNKVFYYMESYASATGGTEYVYYNATTGSSPLYGGTVSVNQCPPILDTTGKLFQAL